MTKAQIVNLLVDWIKRGVINTTTKQPFKEEDILNPEIKDAVHSVLNPA